MDDIICVCKEGKWCLGLGLVRRWEGRGPCICLGAVLHCLRYQTDNGALSGLCLHLCVHLFVPSDAVLKRVTSGQLITHDSPYLLYSLMLTLIEHIQLKPKVFSFSLTSSNNSRDHSAVRFSHCERDRLCLLNRPLPLRYIAPI